jgi:hypothetical protein
LKTVCSDTSAAPGDLCHGDAVETALAEQSPRGLGDQLARLLLLALAQAGLRRFDRAHGEKCTGHKDVCTQLLELL